MCLKRVVGCLCLHVYTTGFYDLIVCILANEAQCVQLNKCTARDNCYFGLWGGGDTAAVVVWTVGEVRILQFSFICLYKGHVSLVLTNGIMLEISNRAQVTVPPSESCNNLILDVLQQNEINKNKIRECFIFLKDARVRIYFFCRRL